MAVNKLKFFCCLSLAFTLFSACICANPDEVKSLPGFNHKTNFRHYSGYLEALNGSFLHYWYFESQSNATSDPLVLWMNGGPGCSSLLGALTEQGPFRVDKNILSLNKYSWNQKANIIFLESPAGVGFSYNEHGNYKIGDNLAALNNFAALKSFFKKYPHLEANDFYITGESYGGIYVPTLSVLALQNKFPKNFKGFAIGNGYLDQNLLGNSLVPFIYYHGLLDDYLWNELVANCCNNLTNIQKCDFVNNKNPACVKTMKTFRDKASIPNLNPYNIYDTCDSSSSEEFSRISFDRKLLAKSLNMAEDQIFVKNDKAGSSPPCVDSSAVGKWLNQDVVREALHISVKADSWTACSNKIAYQNEYRTVLPQVKQLVDAGLKGLIYNGDVDTMCNYLGDKWFVEQLGYKATSEYKYWLVNNQVGGFMKAYSNLLYTTIRGSGHMVPTDRPEVAQHMFNKFLDGSWFKDQ